MYRAKNEKLHNNLSAEGLRSFMPHDYNLGLVKLIFAFSFYCVEMSGLESFIAVFNFILKLSSMVTYLQA